MSSTLLAISDKKNVALSYQPGQFFDICKIEGMAFAIIHKNIVAEKNLSIDLKEYHVVILGNLKAKENVEISGNAVICLGDIISENNKVKINADKLIAAAVEITGGQDVLIATKNGQTITGMMSSKKEQLLKLFQAGIDRDHSLIYLALVSTISEVQRIKELEQKELETALLQEGA